MRPHEPRFTSQDYTEEHADAFAARYDDGLRAVKVNRVREFLGDVRGLTVLDLGCGIGYFASLCTRAGARTIACDFASSMVKRTIRRYGKAFPVVRASAEQPPFRAESFDVVLALDVIEHLYHPIEMLQQVHRLLKPSGRLVVTTDRVGFHLGGIPAYLTRALYRLILRRGLFKSRQRGGPKYQTPRCTHVREYRVPELVQLVESVGFQLTNFDTFPNRARLGAIGHVVEFIGRGALKQYKWAHCVYEFTRAGGPSLSTRRLDSVAIPP